MRTNLSALRASSALVCQVPRPHGAVAQMLKQRIFPSSPRRGGCAIKKKSRSVLSSRRRGGVQPQQNSVELDHHPVRSIKEASRYLVEVASTPPRRGGEKLRTSTIWAIRLFGHGYDLTPAPRLRHVHSVSSDC